jgi:hypothetical protein
LNCEPLACQDRLDVVTVATFQWLWQRPSWHWAYFWAALFLFVPTLVALLVRAFSSKKPRPLVDFVSGLDGKWSTSKAGVLLWTGAIWFAFLAILFHTHGDGVKHAVLKSEYLVVLGIPAGAALAAKGITGNKITTGAADKPKAEGHSNPVKGVGELVSDDSGRADLLDFQYFGFNLILLGFFLFRFFGAPQFGLPNLPETLLAVSGVSAASYVGKKGLSDDAGPTVRSVVPPKAAIGDQILIRGVNLATVRDRTVDITIGEVQTQAPQVTIKDAVTEIATTVPNGAPKGQTELVVIAFDGRSVSHSFEVL